MRSGGKAVVMAALAVLPVASCSMIDGRANGRPALGAGSPGAAHDALVQPANDDHRVIGAPYGIDGQVYTPADVTKYDEIGYAAVLWNTADGRQTADGEVYAPTAIAAAHRTLPLPSYVEVTSIDTGKTIVVRVNDRGPMLNDRIIALTPGAARQLGIATDGTAGVRVRLVSPLEQERATLRAGGQVPERVEIPPGLRTAMARRLPPAPLPLTGPVRTANAMIPEAAPGSAVAMPGRAPAAPAVATIHVPSAAIDVSQTEPAMSAVGRPDGAAPTAQDHAAPEVRIVAVHHTTPQPVQAADNAPSARAPAAGYHAVLVTGGFVVQIAALSSRSRADSLARTLSGYVMPVGALFRVRTGPYASEAAARAALRQIHAKGYADARVMINDAR